MLINNFIIANEAHSAGLEAHPENIPLQDNMKALRADFSREFVNGEPKITNGDVKLKDLLDKFKPLLASDIEIYRIAVNRIGFLKYDPTYLDQLIEIGKPHLKTENANKYIMFTLDEIGGSQDYLEKALQAKAKEGFQKMLGIAKGSMQQSPVTLVDVLDRTALSFPDLVDQIDQSDLKGKNLDDSDFYILIKIGTVTPSELSSEIGRQTALAILLNSQEKPFQNLPKFVDIARMTLAQYANHRNDVLVKMVLRRGDSFLKEDKQTADKITAMIAKSEYGKK